MNYITLKQCSDETLLKLMLMRSHPVHESEDLILAEAKRRGMVDPTYVEQKTESQIWY